ncbi:hypothetical protein [Phenylobacterium sp.]|jgi:hypothetical protein|uniref:hypothetical protein n=1 Tax=Phenylobacterium sp. TaxID=1871053 RepID=UPI002E315630|nr:hypothetical protein [Phenylobacterium sp.]HEX3364994.1 hypothetical protein [Phenylobacterium sp.]
MVYDQIDPARLEGDALTRWYLRSPDDIEQERQEAAAQRYQNFFGGNAGVDPDPGLDAGLETPSQDGDPGSDGGNEAPAKDVEPELSWVQVGPDRWRSVNASDDMSPVSGGDASIWVSALWREQPRSDSRVQFARAPR